MGDDAGRRGAFGPARGGRAILHEGCGKGHRRQGQFVLSVVFSVEYCRFRWTRGWGHWAFSLKLQHMHASCDRDACDIVPELRGFKIFYDSIIPAQL